MNEKENLQIMKSANNYNRWIYDNIKEHVGKIILEIGSGMGAMTTFFENKTLVGLDVDSKAVKALNKKYNNNPDMVFFNIDLSKTLGHLSPESFDTALCINVLEHVLDDQAMLNNIHAVLKRKGKLVLMVPAFPLIYGSIDKADNHYRRYTKKDLQKKLGEANFNIEHSTYMNTPGFFGWVYHGKILKLDTHNPKDIGLFDKLAPTFQKIESIIPPMFGLSIITITQKK